MTLHWILSTNGSWHAWQKGKSETACGRIDRDHLRKYPAQKIVQATPASGKVCSICVRRTGAPPAAAPTSGITTPATAWIVLLRMHLAKSHARLADSLLLELAARLAEVGQPTDQQAREVFEQVRLLLLRPLRTTKPNAIGRTRTISTFPNVKAALAQLQPNTKALLQVSNALRTWRDITNGDLSTNRYRADVVIETILQIPTPAPYIQHLKSRGLEHLAAIFHPNTLARAKKDPALRGLFGGSASYWTATEAQLNIVTD